MEKINLVEILKDCPRGMELECTSYENVSFDKISSDKKATYPIYCYITDEKGNRSSISFTENGCESKRYGAKCVIFPKGKNTWEGFQRPFKDGDIIYTLMGSIAIISKTVALEGKGYSTYCGLFDNRFDTNVVVVPERLAIEEEKEKLFQTIKDKGYKWNPKTKTLENLFSYNIGKKVWIKSDKEHKYIHTIVGISRNSFGNLEYEVKEEISGVVVHYPECLLIPIETKEPKFKVGDKIVNDDYVVEIIDMDIEGEVYGYKSKVGATGGILFIEQDEWELVPNKFDVTTLKPYDKVLARCSSLEKWRIQFFEKFDKTCKFPFICMGYNKYKQCIPYEGNEHLLDTADSCSDYYLI